MAFKKGDYLKQVGGDSGIVYDGFNWVKFECSGCVLASGIALNRLQNGNHITVINRYFKNQKTILHHDKELHNAWLQAGKPIPFKFIS